MEQILLLQTPATFDVSEVIDTYVLKRGLSMNQFDYATAVGLFRSVISLTLVVSTNYLSKKFTEISLW
jgi:putative aldouronate transport system permease protein